MKTRVATAQARRPSEGATLILAVSFAVALGIAFGVWINARLAPATSSVASKPARLLPGARTSAPAAQTSPCDGCETSPSGEAAPARGPAEKADEAESKTDSAAMTNRTRDVPHDSDAAPRDSDAAPPRAYEVSAVSGEARGAAHSEAAVAASPEPSTSHDSTANSEPSRPVAWEVAPLPKAGGRVAARANVERGAVPVGEASAEGGGALAPSGPCTLYASADALRIRVGGTAPLVLGGPGAGVRVNVSTPDSTELAVIYEGPAAGHNGWLRYSVRSVGGRPGLYTVHFSTPCGSQTIPVTVR